MSLVCHTIVSRHSAPRDVETIEEEVEIDQEHWRVGTALIPTTRLHSKPAPNFVPATLECDEYGMPKAPSKETISSISTPSDIVSSLYRSLTSGAREKLPEQSATPSTPIADDIPPPSVADPSQPPRTRTNWFASQPILRNEEGPRTKPESSLSDLLARNPPPRRDEPAFTPPVFLFLGPSNKGFDMLQRKGWQEGEGLGSGRNERQGIGMSKFKSGGSSTKKAVISDYQGLEVKQEVVDLTLSDTEEKPKPEVVDLTLSDTEDEEDIIIDEELEDDTDPMHDTPPSEHHGKTLITPIATTLKADKLGIGLKAKRRKAITHTYASIAAHIRTGNQAKKEFKARFGRGSRGFARAKQKESTDRVKMLAYLNS
ncbi:hypothetical protein M422DRAFT_24522 [Sphaerobolus stellatus SS14]|nr:hypothetical protein M422DRAFT_24522 [Sphaerobolus stellatus SS14]